MVATITTTMSSSAQPKKNSKSRNGCLTCKKKRLKCDETKPHCLNCTKKNIECGGYSTNFKWKSFEETSTSQKIKKKQGGKLVGKPVSKPVGKSRGSVGVAKENNESNESAVKQRKSPDEQKAQLSKSMQRAMSLPESNIFQSALQKASISIAGKTFQELARQNELMVMGMNPNGNGNNRQRRGNSHSKINEDEEDQDHEQVHHLPPPHQNLTRTLSEGSHHFNAPLSPLIPNLDQPHPMIKQEMPIPKLELPGLQHQKLPKLMDLDLFHDVDPDQVIIDEDELSLEENPKHFKRSSSVDSVFNHGNEIETSLELFQFQNAFKQFQLDIPEKFLINTSPQNFNQEFNKIFTAFHTFTSPIMTVKTFSENPWQKYIWPMALENSVLFKAIASMTMAHLGRSDKDLKQQSMVYMKQSINELAEGLTNNSISNDVALATCFSLSVTETWYTQVRTGIAHLRGARSIIQKVLKTQDHGNISPVFKWLCSSFIYHDVLSKLVSSTLIDSTTYDEDSTLLKQLQSLKNDRLINTKNLLHGDLDLNFDQDPISYQSMDDIDPLLGCAHDLFFIIGRTATLITKFKNHKKTLEMVSNAVHFQKELLTWKPNMTAFNQDETNHDPFCDSSALIATSESYRYATLLYLHQAIPEIPSQTSKTLAKKILMLLASIPTNSRTGLLHIFPLLVASCEMDEPEDRQWIINRWCVLSKMMLLGTIDRALEVVKEVWKRKDELKNQPMERSNTTSPILNSKKLNSLDMDKNDWGIEKRIEALTNEDELENKGINSRTHWSYVMKEWGWEVLLG